MTLPYRNFGESVLSDLAVRETENETITFTGNHICAQYPLPVRFPGEDDRDFAARKLKFQKRLPRHSDFSARIALALWAFMQTGEKSYSAAHSILTILRATPAKKLAEYATAGIGYAFRPINFPLSSTRRNRRTTRKKRGISAEERCAQTIRAQAYRFMGKHQDFDAYFRQNLDSFRERFCRDEEWYASAEATTIARVEAFEKLCERFDWESAMPVAAAARFYHEQRKFEAALSLYRKASRAADRAIMHEDFRAGVLDWLHAEAERCERSEGMGPTLVYSGPRLPIANSG